MIERGPGNINYRTKMGNVRKMGENRIIEQQRSDKNYRTTNRSKFRYFFFTPSEENRIIEQQGTVNNRTFVLLNFRSIIPAPTVGGHTGTPGGCTFLAPRPRHCGALGFLRPQREALQQLQRCPEPLGYGATTGIQWFTSYKW